MKRPTAKRRLRAQRLTRKRTRRHRARQAKKAPIARKRARQDERRGAQRRRTLAYLLRRYLGRKPS